MLAPQAALPAPQASPPKNSLSLAQGFSGNDRVLGRFCCVSGKESRATYSYFPGADDESQKMRRCTNVHLLAVPDLPDPHERRLNGPGPRPVSSVISPPAVSGASNGTSQPRSVQQLGHAATAAASQSAAVASYSAQPATTRAWLLCRQGRGAAEFGAGAAGVPLAAGNLPRELPVWRRLPERRGVVVAGALPRRRRLAAAASGGCC